MGFMANYRSLRAPSENDPHADEIEYNFGRAFHQIGMFKGTCLSNHLLMQMTGCRPIHACYQAL